MRFKADRATLLKALAHVQSVVEKRNTIPILANVLIAVRDSRLTLTATDMEIAVVEDVAATTSRTGACTAPAATLYEIVRKLPEGAEVELEHHGGDAQLALRSGRYATSLVVLPTEDFPSMTAGSLPHRFAVSALALRGLIDRTRFAISTEETRYYLNGIYIHAAETDGTRVLRAVATDGHRLARVEEPLPDGAGGMPGVIVPRKTVAELRKLLDEVSGDVSIALSDTRIQFHVDGITLTSKLIDGTFPEYERVIPARQRQGAAGRQERFRRRRRPRRRHLLGTLAPREAVACPRPAGDLGVQPRAGHRHRGTRRRPREIRGGSAGNRLPGTLPQRHHRPDRRRRGVSFRRRRRPHGRARRRRRQRALRADADAGVTGRV